MSETSLTVRDLHTSQWLAERDALLSLSQGVNEVKSDSQLEVAGEIQTNISKAIKRLETERKTVTAPLDDLKKKIMAEEKKLSKPLADELTRIKTLTSAYATECARRIEAERKAAEEAERKAAEAIVAAEDADPYGFNAPVETVATPYIPPVSAMPKTVFNRMVESWDYTITDANSVPRELCSPDHAKIKAFLSSRKAEGYKAEQIQVHGLAITSTIKVQSR